MDSNLIKNEIILILACVGIFISAIWWLWTMSVIRKVLKFKNTEVKILDKIVLDIQDIRNNLNQKT